MIVVSDNETKRIRFKAVVWSSNLGVLTLIPYKYRNYTHDLRRPKIILDRTAMHMSLKSITANTALLGI